MQFWASPTFFMPSSLSSRSPPSVSFFSFPPWNLPRTKSLLSSTFTMSPELQQVHKVWERTRTNSPIYEFLLSEVDVYDAEPGVVRARLQVGPRQLNSKGGLHGAFSASVTDWAGGMAIASTGLDSTGVSTDIHVNYLASATTGDWLEIESRANKVGKSLAFTTVTISKKTESGLTIVTQGSHTKYVRARPREGNVE